MAENEGNGNGAPSAAAIAETMVGAMERLANLMEVADACDPDRQRRSCMSVGDNDSSILPLAGLAGRFSRIADVSLGVLHSPWLRRDQHTRLLPNVQVCCLDADVFDDRAAEELLAFNEGRRYDFCYVNKMLHHLRNNECLLARDPDHRCREDECIGRFVPSTVFRRLFEFANVLIVSEHYYLGEDSDKDSARGGMLSTGEITAGVSWLARHSNLQLHRPTRGGLGARAVRRLRSCEYVLLSATRRRS